MLVNLNEIILKMRFKSEYVLGLHARMGEVFLSPASLKPYSQFKMYTVYTMFKYALLCRNAGKQRAGDILDLLCKSEAMRARDFQTVSSCLSPFAFSGIPLAIVVTSIAVSSRRYVFYVQRKNEDEFTQQKTNNHV